MGTRTCVMLNQDLEWCCCGSKKSEPMNFIRSLIVDGFKKSKKGAGHWWNLCFGIGKVF